MIRMTSARRKLVIEKENYTKIEIEITKKAKWGLIKDKILPSLFFLK